MSLNAFQQPSRRNCRTIKHAEQFKDKHPPIADPIIECYRNNNNMIKNKNKFNGLILSDSMCKYVRSKEVSVNHVQVRISFESGCDCSRMLNYLEKQSIDQNNIILSDFIVFSLCTNDVANLGPNTALQQCRFLIERTRILFPQIKAIGWLALSPRWKPSKLFNSIEINKSNQIFNQLLYKLSKEMHFEIIDANLQHQHMHQDGLHPSIISGRNLIERAIYNWFSKQERIHSSTIQLNSRLIKPMSNININTNQFNHNYHHTTNTNNNTHHHHHPTTTTTTTINTNTNNNHYHHINHINNNNNNNNHHHHHHDQHRTTTTITTTNNNNNKNNRQYNKYNKMKQTSTYYTQEQNNNKTTEYNNQHVSNEKLHYLPGKSLIPYYPHFLRHKQEFFRKITIPIEIENKKEDIYRLSNIHYQTEYFKLESEKWKVYMIAANEKKQIEQIDTIMEINESLPVARPSPTGLARPPASLDITEFAELFDEWLPEPTPGQKRKLGHRRDDPPTPPSPRQPPPIIPRKTLPPRNPNIPKDVNILHSSFEFAIIPIECKYYFKRMREKCTFEKIKAHEKFLENKYKTLEEEREEKLYSSFPHQGRAQVVEFIRNITEKSLDNKKKDNKKRLDNLLLDQMREKATLEIKRTAALVEQEYIQNTHEKFMRTLDLKLQFDKLEKRFVENMPPPSLNSFDKLQLYAKSLKADNSHLSSLREQWKNILRKTKLDLTVLMREAKVLELEETKKEHEQLLKKLPDHLRESYDILCHVSGARHNQFAKRKLNFLAKRAISFPPQANNKALIMKDTETRILNLGPKFVPPAPQQVLERLPKEIEQMKDKVAEAWRRATKTIGREPPLVNKFCQRIDEEIRQCIATEAQRDPTLKPAIKYFQKIQKQEKIIFRQTDKSKVFHADTKENYIEKSEAYMKKTSAYIEVPTSPLKEMIEKTDKFLRNLVSTKQMPQSLLDKLRPSMTESELPHLYYNPKDHKIGEPLRPIVSGIKSPLAKIASFLDKKIRPIFDKHTPYSISNSTTLLRYLKEYKTTSESSIYTFDISDLYTMIPQKEAVLAVYNSFFVLQLPGLEVKYYKQVRGGAMGSACTQVLADIYVRKWESSFVQQQQNQQELYFRFRDDVFLTTKLPPEKIKNTLEELNRSDRNINIQWEGGKSVDYLDVTVTIDIPNFKTTIYRKLAAQPYVLPFNSSHPSHIMRNIPYAAALRLTRICSQSDDLREELDRLRIMLLLNKYPPKFVDQQITRFYKDLTGEKSSDALLGKEHGKYREITLNEQWNKKTKRPIDFKTDILCHFSYTPALARFDTNFHQIWNEIFEGTPLDNTHIVYANRLTDSLKQLLVKKRPSKQVLKLPPQ
ncbi:unnamed protein product [Rotaria sp. Silwood2]|nr:unnamed protein product [Rotaria sp. Silwood2]